MSSNQVKVLDHGSVRLVESYGSDQAIIEAARQSTSASFKGWGPIHTEECISDCELAQMAGLEPICVCDPKEGDEKLLRYLYTNRHMTPFEMAGAIFEIQAPIFVFREWHRHRTQCVSGDTVLVFNRPCDGKAYRKKLEDVVTAWKNPVKKAAISSMQLRGDDGAVYITDAWTSGEKKVYTVKTKYGQVTVSQDHMFKTPDGKNNLSGGLDYIMGVVQVGMKSICQFPQIDEGREEWRAINEWYDVSSMGRVRSWTYQGARLSNRKRTTIPKIKSITQGANGRAITNLGGQKGVQVSHLVAKAFLKWDGSDCVLHKDDNPLDNRVDNLRIGTNTENVKDQYINGGRKFLREAPIKVLSVEEKGFSQTFDISVTGNHWFVADNLLIHNSYNELSARYTPLPDVNYIPSVERLLVNSQSNKQAGVISGAEELTPEAAEMFRLELQGIYSKAEQIYQGALQNGVPKELARVLLPVGRYSRMRASANLRNWLQFLSLRQDDAAQWEIRQYANVVADLLTEKFPRTMALYKDGK